MGHLDAGERAIATLQYLGDALFTTADEFMTVLHRVSVAACGHGALTHAAGLDVDGTGRAAVTGLGEPLPDAPVVW
jgi:hypothetical protein